MILLFHFPAKLIVILYQFFDTFSGIKDEFHVDLRNKERKADLSL